MLPGGWKRRWNSDAEREGAPCLWRATTKDEEAAAFRGGGATRWRACYSGRCLSGATANGWEVALVGLQKRAARREEARAKNGVVISAEMKANLDCFVIKGHLAVSKNAIQLARDGVARPLWQRARGESFERAEAAQGSKRRLACAAPRSKARRSFDSRRLRARRRLARDRPVCTAARGSGSEEVV